MQRGICLGREGRWSKHGKAKGARKKSAEHIFLTPNVKLIFLNTTYSHFGRGRPSHDDSDPEDRTDTDMETETLPCPTPKKTSIGLAFQNPPSQAHFSIQRSTSFPPILPPHEAYLFDYFVSAICPGCSLSQAHNPYLYYITPMSFAYPPLHSAIISVSANELRLVNDRRFEREAWWYKIQALKGLRMSITSGDIGWPFIATILMLCFYDISDGCHESWMTHLRSGLNIMHQLDCNLTESQSLRKFCFMYFVAHQIMGHTVKAFDEDSGNYAWLEEDCIEEIDPLMGCSRGLLDLISNISKVAFDSAAIINKRPLTETETASLTTRCNELERSLHTIQQIPPPVSDSIYLAKVAEVKRITALLFLHERVFTLLQPTARSASALQHKGRLIDTLIQQISPLSNSPTLLWPLFVLGNASPEDEEVRRFVLERLNDLLKLRNLGSVRLARQLIEGKYRSWDLELEGEKRPKGKWISLA